jgi:hypothetical protein
LHDCGEGEIDIEKPEQVDIFLTKNQELIPNPLGKIPPCYPQNLYLNGGAPVKTGGE